MIRKLIKAKQVAEILGISERSVYAGKCGTNQLERVRLGTRTVRFVLQEVEALAEGKKPRPKPKE